MVDAYRGRIGIFFKVFFAKVHHEVSRELPAEPFGVDYLEARLIRVAPTILVNDLHIPKVFLLVRCFENETVRRITPSSAVEFSRMQQNQRIFSRKLFQSF